MKRGWKRNWSDLVGYADEGGPLLLLLNMRLLLDCRDGGGAGGNWKAVSGPVFTGNIPHLACYSMAQVEDEELLLQLDRKDNISKISCLIYRASFHPLINGDTMENG